jgi:Fe-S oxidoreductase
LFCDEFTNYYDVQVGVDAFELLTQLGYQVVVVKHEESGRAFISKGFLKKRKQSPTPMLGSFLKLSLVILL